jgi:hypothetical protein
MPFTDMRHYTSIQLSTVSFFVAYKWVYSFSLVLIDNGRFPYPVLFTIFLLLLYNKIVRHDSHDTTHALKRF